MLDSMNRDQCVGTVREVNDDGLDAIPPESGEVALGQFWAYIEGPCSGDDQYLRSNFDARPFDEALAWARERASKVRVDIASPAGYVRYSAGDARIDAFPVLPEALTPARRLLNPR
jgi:hypothetical protein